MLEPINTILFPMCDVNYLEINKVQMHAGAVIKLLHGFGSVWGDNSLAKAKLGGYLSTETRKSYNNLHFAKYSIYDKIVIT